MRRLSALALLALALTAYLPAAVEAQIYSWRDPEGRLVLSDRPLGDVLRTYAVRESPMVRSTRQSFDVRASSFEPLIVRHASNQGIRPDLVRAIIQTESAFDPFARSRKGALGLMQLMPQTASELGVLDAFDPAENIRAGVAYLRQLLDRYNNNEELALAAYNAGPTAVDRYGSIPPYRETRNYVSRIRNRTGLTIRSGRTKVYRTVEIIDGREVPRYSNVRPAAR